MFPFKPRTFQTYNKSNKSNNMQSNNDLYLSTGYKLKTNRKQIEELNKDLMYWNGKMCASTSSTEIENAHAMIKIIQSEFDKLNNSKYLLQ